MKRKPRRNAGIGIEIETVLLPGLIAECITREVLVHRPLEELEATALTDWLSARAERVYAANPSFRRMLRGRDGRDWLYAFMRHWAAAWVRRELGEVAFRGLLDGFGNGVGREVS